MTVYSTIEAIARQRGGKRSGGGWRIPCPAHNGSDNNLHIEDGGELPLLKCHSHDCDYWDIHKALGFGDKPAPAPARTSTLVAEYTHPDGVVRPVHRLEYPADFDDPDAPCSYQNCGKTSPHKHIWGAGSPDGCFLKLWGLDSPENAVCIAEGEKAAAALVGVPGITPASYRGGAGAAGKADYSPVRGRHVIVWPDDDKQGEAAGGVAVHKAFEAGAASVRLVDAAGLTGEKGADAADVVRAVQIAKIEGAVLQVAPVEFVPNAHAGGWSPKSNTLPNARSDANRLLLDHAGDLLVVFSADGASPAELLTRTPGGVWRKDDDRVRRMHHASLSAYASYAISYQDNPDRANALRWAASGQSRTRFLDMLANIGASTLDEKPPGLTTANERDLDADLGVLGASNGVIDLRTGELLQGEDAAAKLVTRSVGYDYAPGATHADLDRLLAAQDGQGVEYIRQAMAHALGGVPNRRLYTVAGDAAAGKSTLYGAVAAALGEYSTGISSDAVMLNRFSGGANAHHQNRVGLLNARIAVTDELPPGKSLDVRFLKAASGGDILSLRPLREKPINAPSRATIFSLCNMEALDTISLIDTAFADRVKILTWRAVDADQIDTGLKARLERGIGQRQAMLAWLVQDGIPDAPPDDIQSVADAVRQRRLDSLGAAGVWMEARIEHTGDRRDFLTGRMLFDAMRGETPGIAGLDADEMAEYETPKKTSFLARRYGFINANAVSAQVGGKQVRAWQGYRLRPDSQCDADEMVEVVEENILADAADSPLADAGYAPPVLTGEKTLLLSGWDDAGALVGYREDGLVMLDVFLQAPSNAEYRAARENPAIADISGMCTISYDVLDAGEVAGFMQREFMPPDAESSASEDDAQYELRFHLLPSDGAGCTQGQCRKAAALAYAGALYCLSHAGSVRLKMATGGA